MNIDNPEIIGTTLMSITSLLGAYYLILKIRDQLKEKPDPKLTYVTHSQMEKTKCEIVKMFTEYLQDLRSLRLEIREENKILSKYCQRSISEMRELISKNSQNISSLVAQCSSANQRIAELSVKTDRIILRTKEYK